MPSILITGGHTGIGFQCATRIAKHYGLDIILAGRSLDRMASAVASLETLGVNVAAVEMDVSHLHSVRSGAQEIQKLLNGKLLSAIICNAGASFTGPTSYTNEGFELTFATNYLGHFLLTNLLISNLMDDGRVVFVASGTHDPDTLDGKAVGKAAAPNAQALAYSGKSGFESLNGGRRYTSSKLCMIMASYELDRLMRAADTRWESIAYDPGAIPETGLTRNQPKLAQALMKTKLIKKLFHSLGITAGSLEFSGNALADIAVGENYATHSGKYLQSSKGQVKVTKSSRMSYDSQKAKTLWQESKNLVKLQPSEQTLQ